MRKKVMLILAAAGLCLLSACNHLSSEAKKMVGNYYLTVTSEELPIFELKKNGKCVVRHVEPGVLTFSVEGKWNVKNDSLIGEIKKESLDVDGDARLVGNIPERFAFKIVDFTDVSLTIERGGVPYTYHRRPE